MHQRHHPRRGPHLRLLIVNWHDRASPHAGGAEVHLHEVFGRLAARGHDVTLLCSGWDGAPATDHADGMMIHRTGGRHSFALAARRYYRANLRERGFDIVVEDLNKVPLLVPRWTRAPVVLLVHHLWSATALRAAGPLVAGYAWMSERVLLRAYRGRPVQAVSDSTARDLVARGLRAEDIAVIPNGVDAAVNAPGARFHAVPTLVAIGRLQRYKRVDLLLRAFARVRARVPDARLLVIGDGPEAPRLRALVASLGLGSAVELLGSVSEAVKRDALERAWLHVTASEREGWGLTVLEAGARGVPTVAYDVPGLRDSVLHERSGLLVPDGNIVAFADAIMRLMAHPDRRAELGAGARRVARCYTWDRTATATEEHLQEVAVLGRSRRGWEPLERAPLEREIPLSRVGPPPLPYARESFILLAAAGRCSPTVPIRLTFGAEDAEGYRPGVMIEGLAPDSSLALEALSSAAEAVPLQSPDAPELGVLLRLSGWPARPERWIWEEFGAALSGLRPRAVYRGRCRTERTS